MLRTEAVHLGVVVERSEGSCRSVVCEWQPRAAQELRTGKSCRKKARSHGGHGNIDPCPGFAQLSPRELLYYEAT